MFDKNLAPKHYRDRRNLPKVRATFCWRLFDKILNVTVVDSFLGFLLILHVTFRSIKIYWKSHSCCSIEPDFWGSDSVFCSTWGKNVNSSLNKMWLCFFPSLHNWIVLRPWGRLWGFTIQCPSVLRAWKSFMFQKGRGKWFLKLWQWLFFVCHLLIVILNIPW